MPTVYVTPIGSGDGSGSNWANATLVSNMEALVRKAGADGTVLLAADKGAYNVGAAINIWSGGSDGHPVTIKGVSSATGAAMDAVINGTRPATYAIGNPAGNELFKLLGGGNITFEGMTINNTGTAFRVGADMKNVTIQNVDANNVQRFFEDLASGSAKTASVDGLTIRDVTVEGFSKGVIRTQYDTRNVLIENVHGDSQRQDGDNFAMGVSLGGTTHDIVIRNASMDNALSTTAGRYYNGDGFASEEGVYNLRMEDVSAKGNSDGGFDLKSDNTVLIRAHAEGNNKNYRFWGETTLTDSVALDPVYSGGSAAQSQIEIAHATAKVKIVNSTIADSSANTYVFSMYGGVTLENTQVSYGKGAILTYGAGKNALALTSGSAATAVAAGSKVSADIMTTVAKLLAGKGVSLPEAAAAIVAPAGVTAAGISAASVTAAVAAILPTPAATAPAAPAYVAPTVSVAANAAAVNEGAVGATTEVGFSVTRTGDLSKAATIDYSVAGTAANGVDAADFVNATLPGGVVSFAANQATATVKVAVRGDSAVEANEGLVLKLTGATNATIGTAGATTTIVNDDVAYVAPTVSVAATAASVNEGAAGATTSVSFTVARAGDLTRAATVGYAVSGTASDGVDAADLVGGTLPTGSVGFAAGQATATVTVAVRGDSAVEANEGLVLKLTGATDATIGTASATTVILNDDVAPVVMSPIVRGTGVNQTLSGPAYHNEFLFDVAANTGKSTIANFQKSDILVTTLALDDPNKDGIIAPGKGGVYTLDKSGDTVTIASAAGGLRFLGKDADGFLYADAAVRPTWATEGTVGNDKFKADGNASKELFFFDTALGHTLGSDTITNFGERDAIATTTKLGNVAVGGSVFATNGDFLLPGGQGGPTDTGLAGAGGSLHIERSWDGSTATMLEFDGEIVRGDIHYYVYSLVGSIGGLPNVYL